MASTKQRGSQHAGSRQRFSSLILGYQLHKRFTPNYVIINPSHTSTHGDESASSSWSTQCAAVSATLGAISVQPQKWKSLLPRIEHAHLYRSFGAIVPPTMRNELGVAHGGGGDGCGALGAVRPEKLAAEKRDPNKEPDTAAVRPLLNPSSDRRSVDLPCTATWPCTARGTNAMAARSSRLCSWCG